MTAIAISSGVPSVAELASGSSCIDPCGADGERDDCVFRSALDQKTAFSNARQQLMPIGLPKKIWRLFTGEIRDDE